MTFPVALVDIVGSTTVQISGAYARISNPMMCLEKMRLMDKNNNNNTKVFFNLSKYRKRIILILEYSSFISMPGKGG